MSGTGPELVVFVCTGNQCRSPVAEALLRRRLEPGGCAVEVRSAGLLGSGAPPPEEMVRAAAALGLDIAGRPSRPLGAAELSAASLVVGMARQHVVDVVTLAPDAWERTFTFSDLLQRADGMGGRGPDETVAAWAGRLSEGRRRQDVLAAPGGDDVADPMGRSERHHRRVADQLDAMTGRLAELICPG